MSCYICLEEKGRMMSQGCKCKGSLSIHPVCFKTWCDTATDPFLCTVCKADISPVLIGKALGLERVMMFDPEEDDEEYEDEEEWVWHHGVPVISDEDCVYFQTDEHRSIFIESEKRELQGMANECRNIKHSTKQTQRSQHGMKRTTNRVRYSPQRR